MAQQTEPTRDWAVQMRHVSKTFGPVHANRDVSLSVARGEIHAVVGENGAGKSTLMHILSGLYAPSGGTVSVLGRDVTGWDTNAAIAVGVGMVHQHFMLVPTLTVSENLVLGREPRRGVMIDRAQAGADVRALSQRTGLVVDADALVADLSVGEAQRVEILKVLYRGANILVLDEPTAVLSPPEVEELWTVLRMLRDRGDTIIIITHKLDEVIAISDTITVMRDGRSVARLATSDTTPRDIAKAMVGRDVVLALDAVAGHRAPSDTSPLPAGAIDSRDGLVVAKLSVTGDRGRRMVNDLTFTVRPGEILGIAGVEGNGQTELLEAIAGLRSMDAGTIAIGARTLNDLTVRERTDAGLSHIPEDRHRRGLVLDYSIADNLILGRQHHFSTRTGLDATRVAENAELQVRTFDIRPPQPALPARALSGGNQQKIVIAREMGRAFTVLLAAQPTRGVDVGAIEFIHSQLRAARDAGKAVLLVSADLAEVLALSDRIAVMYEGQFACVLPAHGCTAERLGPFMMGAEREAVA